jgi:hypothetical protein
MSWFFKTRDEPRMAKSRMRNLSRKTKVGEHGREAMLIFFMPSVGDFSIL